MGVDPPSLFSAVPEWKEFRKISMENLRGGGECATCIIAYREVGHLTQVPGRTRKARRRKECSYVTETRSGFVRASDLAFESTRRNDGVFGAW